MIVTRILASLFAGTVMLIGWPGGFVTGAYAKTVTQKPTEKSSGYKLPTFKSDRPRFCLLKLPTGGDESKACLIAVDDSTLFIDLNFNKDLTEPSERITAKKLDGLSKLDSVFEIPVIQTGSRSHRAFVLTVSPLKNRDKTDSRIEKILSHDPAADSYELSLEIELRQFQGIGAGGSVPATAGYEDLSGILQFGANPADAPQINFTGDFEVRLSEDIKLRLGSNTEVTVLVGTSGKGPGTFAAFSYHGVVPETAFPRLKLAAVSLEDDTKIVSDFDITHRC